MKAFDLPKTQQPGRSASCRIGWIHRFAGVALLAAPLLATVSGPASASAASCGSLTSLSLPNTTVTLAESVPAGSFTVPAESLPPALRAAPLTMRMNQAFKNLPPFCRVAATTKTSADSEMKVEVWMPSSGWNGKLIGVGNGGWSGWINYKGLAESLQRGYASASTDTGHSGGGDASFALGHPERLIDLGYRSTHLMTVEAKPIMAAFYGSGPRFAYWNGCSTGGKQGLTEAQRYPDDYDGIIVGDPANYWTHLMFSVLWPAEVSLKDSASYVDQSQLQLVHQAVMNACDALDGLRDGIINDPTQCHFDPKVLACKNSADSGCLTGPQVQAIRQIYAGPRNPRTGQQVFPGPEFGSELGWHIEAGPGQQSFFKELFNNRDWQWQTLNLDQDVALADKVDGNILNAIDPDLKAFKAHGGKLLMYHGWSDPIIAPGVSVNYYDSVVKTMGGLAKTQDFARLFMIPGMAHCQGGPGADDFDKVGVLDQWVEHGVVPDEIVASHRTHGVVDMTRPLCPYPETVHWKGSGSGNHAANFVCESPTESAK